METILLSAGIACVIAAIVGGGLKAFNIEIPLLDTVNRQVLLFMAGALFMAVALMFPQLGGEPDTDAGPRPSQDGRNVFVYGTFKPGESRYAQIDEFVASTRADKVSGSLFDTGRGFPAAKFGTGNGEISGYVLEIVTERSTEALETIADLEGNLFRPVVVETEDGIAATAYEYIPSTDGMARINDGIWDGNKR